MPTKEKRNGRNLIINEAMVKRFEDLLMSGNSQRTACVMVGINESTFYQWLQISEALAIGEEHPETPKKPKRRKNDTDGTYKAKLLEYEHQIALLTNFSERIKKANHTFETGLVSTVVDAAFPKYDDKGNIIREGNWTAAMTLLERRNPQDWARRTMGNTPDGGHTHKVVIEVVNESADE